MTSSTPLAGRYVLGELLGRGGMADVHRAVDQRLARAVAVKVLRTGADSTTERARFRAEIAVLARLNHPAVVTLLDAGVGEDRSFLVMELVDGPTLREALHEGPLGSVRVASIGAQLAAGLAYAHTNGVVHRDVKPGNVLLDADAGHHGSRARLGDFGIARVLGETLRHTQTGMAVGTAAYLSPEQVTGQDAGAPSDVYSLGLVLLEALTGQHPFPGAAAESMAARLERAPVVPTDLTPAWRRLLTAMTAGDPAARPTAAAVAVELALPATQAMPVVAPRPAVAATRVEIPVVEMPVVAAPARSRRPAALVLLAAGALTLAVLGAGIALGGGSGGAPGAPTGSTAPADADLSPVADQPASSPTRRATAAASSTPKSTPTRQAASTPASTPQQAPVGKPGKAPKAPKAVKPGKAAGGPGRGPRKP